MNAIRWQDSLPPLAIGTGLTLTTQQGWIRSIACNLAQKQSVHIKLKYTFISKERKVPDKYGGYEGSDYKNGNIDVNELVAAIDSAHNANVNNEAH